MRALITTTINVPGNLESWRNALDDDDPIIVAGDQQSPHNEISEFLANLPGDNVYLGPAEQGKWESSSAIGWRCVQRRNIALLEAIKRHPDYIITVDDDNYPLSNLHGLHLDDIFAGTVVPELVTAGNGWFNPGIACVPPVIHRGFPMHVRNVQTQVDQAALYPVKNVGVVASLWTGDPDIDAIERLHSNPTTRGVSHPGVILNAGTWAPFNSQATAFKLELAPAMYMWPGVGRYDDIWASYLMRAIMDRRNLHVHYGEPLVHQLRNEHDLLKDLEAEVFGMRHTPHLVQCLRHASKHLTEGTVRDQLFEIWHFLSSAAKYIPDSTRMAWGAWLEDLKTVGVE